MDKKSNEILAALVKDILRVGREEKRTVHEEIAAVAVESYRLGYKHGTERKPEEVQCRLLQRISR